MMGTAEDCKKYFCALGSNVRRVAVKLSPTRASMPRCASPIGPWLDHQRTCTHHN